MIILDIYPVKIFDKKDNLYIYNYSRPFKGETTKIIIKKNKFLARSFEDGDEDYWQFIVGKIVKLSNDWSKLCEYLKRDKFNFCKKVKLFAKNRKIELKVMLYKISTCFIFDGSNYHLVNLEKIRYNKKLYKKFENRFCYSWNYDHPDNFKYADIPMANIWFQWFVKTYQHYVLPVRERTKKDITLGGCYIKSLDGKEPKMDYDSYELFW